MRGGELKSVHTYRIEVGISVEKDRAFISAIRRSAELHGV